MISIHLNRDKLHHAYLIEGRREDVLPEILDFLSKIKISTLANPDLYNISFDALKIDDAHYIRAMCMEKKITSKKVFIIFANNILLEAQNTFLKILEEPGEDILFIFIVPDANTLLPTFVSRFYFIRSNSKLPKNESEQARKFISISKKERLEFLKELTTSLEEEEGPGRESIRSKSLTFLNSLERILEEKLIQGNSKNINYFEQIFRVREYLRQPGSSTKSLMESVALSIPIF